MAVWTLFLRRGAGILCGLLAALEAPASEPVDYLRQIKPLFEERCLACHGALKQEGNLRLDTAKLAQTGGDSGPAIQPGDPAASVLLERVSSTDDSTRMPPEGEPLKPGEIAAIREWIAQNAPAPADEKPEEDPLAHWAFQCPIRPSVPTVTNQAWQANPIDAFLSAEHEKRGLVPQPATDKRLWLRRVTLDLIGLPPTLAEQQAFLADETEESYEKVITRLLDSPQYGERWGRHWMDIWRYSDAWGLGKEVRNSQKHLWHWRDWIIESLNEDKGYHQMLREMLAADELYPTDPDKLRASGFLARQYFKFNRTTWMDEVVEHTGKALVGLTFNCAKCHDHKYDPFSQVEYYQLRAIFEPYQIRIDAVPGVLDPEKDGIPRAFDCNLTAETFLHIRGDDRNPDKSQVIKPLLPGFITRHPPDVRPVSLPVEAFQPGVRPEIVATHLQQAQQTIQNARKALEAARTSLQKAEEAADQPQVAESPLLHETFDATNPDLWDMQGGDWSYRDGKLVQSLGQGKRASLRLRQDIPLNFQARLQFITTGGNQWRSVGIAFDSVSSGGNDVLGYLSAHEGGSKAQISYTRNQQATYPPAAAKRQPVQLGQPYTLTIRVRDTLVNLLVNEQHTVSYRLPIERQPGSLELITFDAQAEFLDFELRELSPMTIMQEAGAPSADSLLPVDQAQLTVQIAEAALRTAELLPASIESRAIADRQRYAQPAQANVPSLITQAARTERQIEASKAEENVLKARLETLKSSADKKAAADQKLAEAEAAWATAKQAIETPGDSYQSLSGAYKTLESNVETEESRRKPFPPTSTGRRTAFAEWLTNGQHPLTARVAVNHIWLRHMGQALVPTVFDFGRKGTPPTHPELLDWLAVEFMEHGWSMKHLHRLIVSSQAYRLSSSSAAAAEQNLRDDPDNHYYWRAQPTRMEAQIIRDSLLALAGELDLQQGGPSIPVSDETSKRRSLYYIHSHNDHQHFLSMFDDASVLDCYRRSASIVPQQALALENSELAQGLAVKIAERMLQDSQQLDQQTFVTRAFLTILATPPTAEEQKLVTDAMQEFQAIAERQGKPKPEEAARIALVQALLNHNDFVTIR